MDGTNPQEKFNVLLPGNGLCILSLHLLRYSALIFSLKSVSTDKAVNHGESEHYKRESDTLRQTYCKACRCTAVKRQKIRLHRAKTHPHPQEKNRFSEGDRHAARDT